MNNTSVESYLRDGCGRCELFATPQCKVHRWTHELIALREIVRKTGLAEQMKWGAPCYSLDGTNVVMVAALKDSCVLSFFSGAALIDPGGDLESPGPNSRYGRYLRFRSIDDVIGRRYLAEGFLAQAIELARSGTKVVVDAAPEALPDELEQALAADPALMQAFEALTPGRRRSHAIYVAGAKQPEARVRRVERCVPKILAGMGFNER